MDHGRDAGRAVRRTFPLRRTRAQDAGVQEFRTARNHSGGARRRQVQTRWIQPLRRFRSGHRSRKDHGRDCHQGKRRPHARDYGHRRRRKRHRSRKHGRRRIRAAGQAADSDYGRGRPGRLSGDRPGHTAAQAPQFSPRHHGRLRRSAVERGSKKGQGNLRSSPGEGEACPGNGRRARRRRLPAYLRPADRPAPMRQGFHPSRKRTKEHTLHVHHAGRAPAFRDKDTQRDGGGRGTARSDGLVRLHRHQFQDKGRPVLQGGGFRHRG